ncbi:MAG: prepilin-type N-terminal cleavage/methylation domain-containing protein, partial [Thiomargarita sp.]|nr:prepilin-type N-terminal cleavage/methylation domain-containing protein [Thiomargarita sp.]
MKITQGFTLIEISLVLIITGILIGSVVIPTVNQYQDQRRIQITKQHLKKIKVALLNFITLHGYLPCPALDLDDSDPNFGKAASQVNGVCEDYEDSDGYLPWLDLNVSRYDGWGNQFRYRVDGWFNNSDGI